MSIFSKKHLCSQFFCGTRVILAFIVLIGLIVHVCLLFSFFQSFENHRKIEIWELSTGSFVNEIELFMNPKVDLLNSIHKYEEFDILPLLECVYDFENSFLPDFVLDEDLRSFKIYYPNSSNHDQTGLSFDIEYSTNFLVTQVEKTVNTSSSNTETRIRNLPLNEDNYQDFDQLFSETDVSEELSETHESWVSCKNEGLKCVTIDGRSKMSCQECSDDLLVSIIFSVTGLEANLPTYPFDYKISYDDELLLSNFISEEGDEADETTTLSTPLSWEIEFYDSEGPDTTDSKILFYVILFSLIIFISSCFIAHLSNYICTFLYLSCNGCEINNHKLVLEVSRAVSELDFTSPAVTRLLLLEDRKKEGRVKICLTFFLLTLPCFILFLPFRLLFCFCCDCCALVSKKRRQKKSDHALHLALRNILKSAMSYKEFLPNSLLRETTDSFQSVEEIMSYTSTTRSDERRASINSLTTTPSTNTKKKTTKKKFSQKKIWSRWSGSSSGGIFGSPASPGIVNSPLKNLTMKTTEASLMLIDMKGIDHALASIQSDSQLKDYFCAYFDCLIPLIHGNNGTIHSITSQEIICSWNLQRRKVDHVRAMAQTAVLVREKFSQFLVPFWREKGFPPCEVSIGIYSNNEITTGFLGSSSQSTSTCPVDRSSMGGRGRFRRFVSPRKSFQGLKKSISKRLRKKMDKKKKYEAEPEPEEEEEDDDDEDLELEDFDNDSTSTIYSMTDDDDDDDEDEYEEEEDEERRNAYRRSSFTTANSSMRTPSKKSSSSRRRRRRRRKTMRKTTVKSAGFGVVGSHLKELRKLVILNDLYETRILMSGQLRQALRFISVNQCVDVRLSSDESYFELRAMKSTKDKEEWNYELEELEKMNTSFDMINDAWRAYGMGDLTEAKKLLATQIEKFGMDKSARRLFQYIDDMDSNSL